MNCADCQRYCMEDAGGDLPEAAAAHLLECAACRRVRQRSISLQQLLRLKRHEQPDAAFEVRNLARVQAAIRDLPAPRGWWLRLWDAVSGPPVPALRYAAAAVVLGLLGISWLSVRSLPPLPTASIEAVRAAQPASLLSGPPAIALTPPGGEPVAPGIFVTSNQQPWRMEGDRGPQYGTRSRLAGFEF